MKHGTAVQRPCVRCMATADDIKVLIRELPTCSRRPCMQKTGFGLGLFLALRADAARLRSNKL